MTKPKSSEYKIAFTGTNCSGKTTTALEVTGRLKSEHHHLAEVVSSQDRKITWADVHFPVNPVAHYGMITNLIHAEVQAMLKGDATTVITDRSALDLYAIALTDHPDSEMVKALGVMVKSWMTTYTKVFYLPPLPYQEDGKRPADDFRMRTHATLMNLIQSGDYPNIERIEDRTQIFKKVRGVLGLQSPNPVILAESAKWQFLADSLSVPVAVKSGRHGSDIDAWCLLSHTDDVTSFHSRNLALFVDTVFGRGAPVDLMTFPLKALAELSKQHAVTVYQPS